MLEDGGGFPESVRPLAARARARRMEPSCSPHEGTPGSEEGKLPDEARKALFGKSEEETAPEDKDHNQHYSGASESGTPNPSNKES